MSKTETFVDGALPVPGGMCCGKGLLWAAALIAGLAAVYILAPRLKPSAKWLLASMSNVLAVGTLRVRPSLWLCVGSLHVSLLHGSAAVHTSRHTQCCSCLLRFFSSLSNTALLLVSLMFCYSC